MRACMTAIVPCSFSCMFDYSVDLHVRNRNPALPVKSAAILQDINLISHISHISHLTTQAILINILILTCTHLLFALLTHVTSFEAGPERNSQCALAAGLAYYSLAPYPELYPNLYCRPAHHLVDATPAAVAPPCAGHDASA